MLVISAVWFGEPIGWPQILGTVLILGGICCLAVSESSTVPKIEHAGSRRGTARAAGVAAAACLAGQTGGARRPMAGAGARRFQRARRVQQFDDLPVERVLARLPLRQFLSWCGVLAVGGAEPALPGGPVVPDRDVAGDIAADDLAMQGLRQRLQVARSTPWSQLVRTSSAENASLSMLK